MEKIDDFVLSEEASKIIGVCKKTLINWEKAGKIKVMRNPMNNYRLYSKQNLFKFLDSLKNNK